MESVKSEPRRIGVGRNGQDQRVRSVNTIGLAISSSRVGAEVEPTQSESVSIGSDDSCCALKSSNFWGKLRFEGSARIECEVAGEIHGTDVITIAECAVVTGPIRAASVLIEGRVGADVIASKRIEIRSSARVLGNLTAPTIMVDDGAKIEGRCTINSGLQGSGS